MRKNLVLHFPKTQDGHDLSCLLRSLAAGPRMALPTFLAQATMVWAGSDRSNQPWGPTRSAEIVRIRPDLATYPLAPIYRMWDKGQTDMPFAAWLAMATYYGFARIRKDALLAPLLDAFSGASEAPVKVNLEPTKARPAKIQKEEPTASQAPPAATASVKSLKGMF